MCLATRRFWTKSKAAQRILDRFPVLEEQLDGLRDSIDLLAARHRAAGARAAKAARQADTAPDPVRDPEGYRRHLEEKHRDTLSSLRTKAQRPN